MHCSHGSELGLGWGRGRVKGRVRDRFRGRDRGKGNMVAYILMLLARQLLVHTCPSFLPSQQQM